MRSFAPTGHRHTAEVLQALQLKDVETDVHLSATAVDNVRGVLATAHVFVKPGVGEKDVWKAYREAYTHEPFVRIVKERTGLYRYPEPKILSGSNYADVGFEMDPNDRPRRGAVRDRQPDEGRGRHGAAVRQRDDGLGRDAGLDFPGCTRSDGAGRLRNPRTSTNRILDFWTPEFVSCNDHDCGQSWRRHVAQHRCRCRRHRGAAREGHRAAAGARRRADDQRGGRGARPSAAVRDQRNRPRQPPHRSAHARDLRDGLLRPAQQDVGREAAARRA